MRKSRRSFRTCSRISSGQDFLQACVGALLRNGLVDLASVSEALNRMCGGAQTGRSSLGCATRKATDRGVLAMAPGGVEPPRTDSKSVALSAELRGRAQQRSGV
jgi:hypothetical protein